MKLAVLCLAFALFLAAATANTDYIVDDEQLTEFIPLDYAEESIDPDILGVFGPLYFTIKASLRTLKGVNCTIKRVMSIRSAGVDFLEAVEDCNTGVLKDFNALINQVQAVVNTCNDIINLNSNVCNNGTLDDEMDANKKTPARCASKLLNKMITLKKQISKTIKLSKKLPSTPGTYAGCASSAVGDMISVFTEFPTFVKNCSKLKN
ncbi:uncharacterized protein LOC118747065 [Rhagoletis pomonella]|uniref:uncharacterized protein LOC118747065 n=1 Tax=Rhagoletis pomonella TaxID=28610 RepID=UPI001786691A|nr:uncharacterized protein LOC118747065 [Rhagoletis pomonella]